MSANVRYWVSKKSLLWMGCWIVAGAGLSVTLMRMYRSSATQPEGPATIVEILGQLNPGDGVLVNEKPVQAGAPIGIGQQLMTQAGVRVAVQATNGEGTRLGEKSSLMVEKDCLQLGDGSAVMSGVSGCVGAIVVSGKKGIYSLERVNYLAEIKVLAGQVEVSVPRNPAAQSIHLQTGQKITIGLTGDEVGPVRLMLPSEVQRIISGGLFQGFQTTLPNQAEIAQLQTPSPFPSPPTPGKSSAIAPSPAPSPATLLPPAASNSTLSSPRPVPPSPAPMPSSPTKPAAAAPALPLPVESPRHPPVDLRPKYPPGCS